ncbi:hypothetical protein [Sorangium cellulosum]|uniref:Uncharacterized protein n=1 Tax=Sorangium cellulosum TaxID=56 RepID=A0A150Q8R9_SORCE|nr:hypothetical protein [Sorangium cellulosum]KYF64360.1 hypothetical protein BE15_29590 [Sorangium cellulosum]
MPKTKTDLDLWMKEALASPGNGELSISVPLHVLFGEAVDIARFHKTYWKPEVKDGKVVRRGLEMAARKKKNGDALTAKTGEELLSLQRAAVEAGTRYLLAVDPKKASPFERGQVVLDEITATLEWLFDDGVEDENDARLAKLGQAHADDPATADALALALDDYAALAAPHREAMDDLGGFDVAMLDEARELAAALRARLTENAGLGEKAREARVLRNKVIGLLLARMSTVRAAARFVFRDRPDIVREATSAYERRRRAESARRAKKKVDAPPPAPPLPPVSPL